MLHGKQPSPWPHPCMHRHICTHAPHHTVHKRSPPPMEPLELKTLTETISHCGSHVSPSSRLGDGKNRAGRAVQVIRVFVDYKWRVRPRGPFNTQLKFYPLASLLPACCPLFTPAAAEASAGALASPSVPQEGRTEPRCRTQCKLCSTRLVRMC